MKPRPVFNIFVCLVSLSFSAITAQNAVLSAGGDASGTGGSSAFSVGQVAYTYISGEGERITLGVQQPHFVIMVDTDEPLITISATAYPNPASNFVSIRFDDQHQDEITLNELSFGLYDIEGRLLMSQDINTPITNVSLEKMKSGLYLFRINRNNTEVKTFKIFKTN